MADRWRRRRRRRVETERHPDQLPKRGLFTEPIRVSQLTALEPEWLDTEAGDAAAATTVVRVTFLIEVKDAEGRRCSDLAVDAHMSGPDRDGHVEGHTDMFGRVKVQMTGPPGRYALEVLDVAARALHFDRTAGPTVAEVAVDAPAG